MDRREAGGTHARRAVEWGMDLSTKQQRHLRALAHHLSAVVQVGTAGVTEALIAKVDVELENHELVKVKVSKDAPEKVNASAEAIRVATSAGLAQVIGHTMVLYRPRKKKPSIKLPE